MDPVVRSEHLGEEFGRNLDDLSAVRHDADPSLRDVLRDICVGCHFRVTAHPLDVRLAQTNAVVADVPT
ncbi:MULTISPECIES: hypothetical protein [unclassified Aeromicrobium]|uniref:hypothetical protein n=1 Tax=unclassified Aeromicrobium TaxID=2633570 RepID=UPI0025801EDF|nr:MULTISPECIES: hypothetical protein [unclassified Aeromicrobium]